MNLEEALDIMKQRVFAVHTLSVDEWNDFSHIWQPVSFKRKTVLTTAGETERNLYFVLEGVQRAFYMDADHPEATIIFTYPYSYSGVADSFLTQRPSKYFMETITASKMLKTTHQQVQQLMDKYHNVERYIRIVTSGVLMGVLERHIELL